jgi:hypothetical protein
VRNGNFRLKVLLANGPETETQVHTSPVRPHDILYGLPLEILYTPAREARWRAPVF